MSHSYGFLNGNKIEWYVDLREWRYEDGELYAKYDSNYKNIFRGNLRPCPCCGEISVDGLDPCFKEKLPGVIDACCGHGVHKGYISFENGTIIRGDFKIYKKEEK